MFCVPPWRRRPEGPPGTGDGGAFPQHPPGAGPEEFSSRSRHRRPWLGWAWLWWLPRGAGDTGMRHSRGAGDSGRDAWTPGEAGDGPGWAQVNGKEPGSLRSGGARQEQAEVRSGTSGIQAPGKDSGDKAGVPRRARNGNVPREGTERPRRPAPQPPRAGRCEDEEGEPGGNSQSREKDRATALRNGNVPREGTDRPRRPAPQPPRAGIRQDEEGEPGGNSQSRDMDMDGALQNGNVLREGMDQPVCLPTVWVISSEGEEGEPGGNSRNRDTNCAAALRNGNVPREGTERPRRPAPQPPRAGIRQDEEGEPGGNSQSQDMDMDGALQNRNVLREGMDQPVCLPSFTVISSEGEEGEPGGNSRNRDTNCAAALRNGNVPREGTDRPRRPAPQPPRAGRCEDEEGDPGGNSRSREKDTATALRNGNVPKEGMDQPVCLPSFTVISSEGEEGESSGNSRSQGRDTDAASTPGRDRGTEPGPGAERREWLCQRLRGLGEDMEGWAGRPTAELAAGLARRIAGMPPGSYPPAGPGTHSTRWEQGSGDSSDCGVPGGIYRSLREMLRASGSTESTEEDLGLGSGSGSGSDQEQGCGASPECSIPSRNNGIFLGMPEEDSGLGWGSGSDPDWEQSSGASPDCDVPSGNDGCFIGMLRASGNAEDTEADSGSEQERAAVSVGCGWDPRRLDRRFREVWARSPLDCGRVAEEEELHGDPVPFQRQRRPRPHEEQQMAELLQEYLEQGIVVEGTSESNNPLILEQKPHGRGARLSLDCAALNAATPVAPQERPDRKGILTSISPRSRFFSVLDLSNACLAIPLAPACWGRFAFTFRGRQFLFTRLPPRFRGSGSIVHRRVAAMLARLEPGAARGVFHYSDDILITGKWRRQVRYRTRRVLELIQKTGFKVNRDKAQLVQPEVNYLGMTLGAAGRRASREKLLQICGDCEAAGPWDPARLRSVLGKFNDLREFIPDYLELALPLQSLVAPGKWKRERERDWQREWERERGWERLQGLKEALKAAPALLFPNKSRPFAIRLSVHARTVGAVLLQEKEGTLLPVQHWSRRLSGGSWAPQDAWCLAAVWAVQAFQKLTGPAPILIREPTGRYLFRGEPLRDGCHGDPQLPEQWWVLVTTKGPERQESPPVSIPLALEFWQGPERQESLPVSIPLAPELGQLPPDVPKANIWFLAVQKGSYGKQRVAFAAASLEERWLLGLRQGREEEEEKAAMLEALRELLEQHRSRFPLFLYSSWPGLAARLRWPEPGRRDGDAAGPEVLRWLRSFPGMLHVRQVGTHGEAAPEERRWMREVTARARAVADDPESGRKVWEPSASERQEIVAQCHRRRHEGVEGTLARVRKVQRWRGDREDVACWVRRCPECRDGDPHPAPQRERGPRSRLRISLSPALPASPEGFRAVLLVQDELSGWLDAFPLRQPAQPEEVSRLLLREVFGRFGKVEAVLLEPEPAWLWELLWRPPLLGRWGHLECVGTAGAAAQGAVGVARALGAGWAAALPLVRAGMAARWVREEELGALLCDPEVPLEVRWERPGDGDGDRRGNGNGDGKENEISRLRRMEIQPGYRERVRNALQWGLGSGAGSWEFGSGSGSWDRDLGAVIGIWEQDSRSGSWDQDQGLGAGIRMW